MSGIPFCSRGEHAPPTLNSPSWMQCPLAGVLLSGRNSAKKSWRSLSEITVWTPIGSCRSRKNTVRFAGTHRAAQNGFIGRSFRSTRKCPAEAASSAAGPRHLFRKIGSLPGAMPALNSMTTKIVLILMFFTGQKVMWGKIFLRKMKRQTTRTCLSSSFLKIYRIEKSKSIGLELQNQ